MEQQRVNGRPYIKILSYIFIFLSIIFLIVGLLSAISVFMLLKEGVFYKKLLLSLGTIIATLIIFFVFFGIHRLIKNYLYLTKKVIIKEEEIEEELEDIVARLIIKEEKIEEELEDIEKKIK